MDAKILKLAIYKMDLDFFEDFTKTFQKILNETEHREEKDLLIEKAILFFGTIRECYNDDKFLHLDFKDFVK